MQVQLYRTQILPLSPQPRVAAIQILHNKRAPSRAAYLADAVAATPSHSNNEKENGPGRRLRRLVGLQEQEPVALQEPGEGRRRQQVPLAQQEPQPLAPQEGPQPVKKQEA